MRRSSAIAKYARYKYAKLNPSFDELKSRVFKVYTEVMEAITRNNITIIMGWELINWKLEDTSKGKMIESIVIKSKGKSETISCDFLINFNEKTIGMKIFLGDYPIFRILNYNLLQELGRGLRFITRLDRSVFSDL